jgi:CTP:molybdopterin cytidylyltransferase MocA
MIATIVLAAGSSTRFGSPKLLAEWWGRPLVEWALQAAPDSGPRVAVVRRETVRLRPLFAAHGFAVVRNPRPSNGLASSLRIGLDTLPREIEAALVLLGDSPAVPPSVVERVLTAYRREDRAVAAAYDGQRDHPVILPRAVWADLPRRGDRAGADVDVVLEECGDLVVGSMDVDTPDDLFALAARRFSAPLVADLDGAEALEQRLADEAPFVLRARDADERAADGPLAMPVLRLRDRASEHGRMIQIVARVGDDYAALVG